MRKSTKGAVAASMGALLLLGGWGTQASWTDDDSMPGTAMGTGDLKLVSLGCSNWLLKVDLNDSAPVQFNSNALKLGPGNILTESCTFQIDAGGAKVKAQLTTGTPQGSGTDATALMAALDVAATYEDAEGDAIPTSTTFSDGDKVTANLTVTLPSTVGNSVKTLTAALDDITVTATTA